MLDARDLAAGAAARLAASGAADPERESALLLLCARAGAAGPLTAQEARRFAALLERRLAHEPIEYIVGTTTFMGLELAVDRRVQVTRPAMVDVVRETAAVSRRVAAARRVASVPVADVGTGCGALAIALAVAEPAASPIYAVDVSPAAVAVARDNVRATGTAHRVVVREGSLLDPVPEPVAVVMANLAFVPQGLGDALDPGVAEYEPAIAVFGEGETGWTLQRRLLEAAAARPAPPAAVVVTFHVSQQAEALAAARAAFPDAATAIAPLRPGWSGMLTITAPS